uniref:C3H1-type domain-containing protein n=1 Tax=Anopheles atroparvus TaxID=41427 RepID=A0AAG5CNC5_ANOAO
MISKCRSGTKLRLSMMLLVITCLCFEHVKGSCLSYGHSCWGAHGKRGGPPKRAAPDDGPETLRFRPQPALDETNAISSVLTAADRWALVRVLPNKIPYYPFSKMIHSQPPLPVAPFFFGGDTDMVEPDSPGTSSKLADGSTDASNDSKQTLSSAELGLALGDERHLVLSGKPAATANVRRRDHSRRKNPSTTTRSRYATIDDSYEDNPSMDRSMSPTDEEIGQMLLLDAAAAAAASVSSDSDGAPASFNRKLLSANTKNA